MALPARNRLYVESARPLVRHRIKRNTGGGQPDFRASLEAMTEAAEYQALHDSANLRPLQLSKPVAQLCGLFEFLLFDRAAQLLLQLLHLGARLLLLDLRRQLLQSGQRPLALKLERLIFQPWEGFNIL